MALPDHRITFLDGHRGLAIALVIGYHLFARWPEIVPYGDRFADVALFQFGWLGVRLFFLVSGFVILMTLEKCASRGEFLYRRWLRLFPGMLVCSLLLLGTAPWLTHRPEGQPTVDSLLPGITFLSPAVWQWATGLAQTPLEASFWSLYAEAKFYVFAALVYFWRGRLGLVVATTAAYGLAVLLRVLQMVLPSPQTDLAYAAVQALSFQHFGWFAAGAMLYVFHAQRQRGWLLAALALAIVCSLGSASTALSGSRSMAAAASILVVVFFVGSLGSPLLQRFLNLRLWQFLGFISYPLYLLHENALISMTAQLGEAWPRLAPAVLPWLPLIPLAVIFAVAWVIASRVEPALRRGLAACFKQFRTAQVPS